MIEAILVIALMSLTYWLGWMHRNNWDWMRAQVLKRNHPDVLKDQPRSMIVEPRDETPAERAKREQDELIESLNPPR